MSLFRRGEIWWLYVVHNGQRLRRSTGEREKARAQAVHDEFRYELRRLKPSRGTFYGALDTWAKDAGSADKDRVAKLKRLYSDRPLEQVTAESLEKILPASSPNTFNRYAILVTAALNRERKAGRLETVPHIQRMKAPPGRIRWLTQKEWKRLYEELPEHLKPMARFAVSTGLRQHNVTHLEWSQVDMTRKVAWIHPDQAKARRAIGIPLSAEAMSVLRAQKGQHEVWVFPYGDKPLDRIKASKPTEKSAGGAFQRAVARAGLKDFTWHDLRHTWASWHVQSGTPLHILKELGGWASLAMVLRYSHLAPEHLRAYANNARSTKK